MTRLISFSPLRRRLLIAGAVYLVVLSSSPSCSCYGWSVFNTEKKDDSSSKEIETKKEEVVVLEPADIAVEEQVEKADFEQQKKRLQEEIEADAKGAAAGEERQEQQQHAERKEEETADLPVEYGVDVSFPIHHDKASTNYPWLPHNVDPANNPTPPEYQDMPLQPLGDRQSFYEDFVDGCVKKYGQRGKACLDTEYDRVEMSLRQPQSMQNYTELGYKKIRTPPQLWTLIENFWEANKQKTKPEQWGMGNTYVNHWVSPTDMISVEDSSLRGGGYQLKQKVWDAARSIITAWTGEELTECSLYGIRVYHENAVLATHVDRLPLVASAIINVAQDVDEPWPLEVIGHDGKAVNVTMETGDMVLYESHSVLHGRPFPMKGRYFANIFVHFEPTGHSLRHNAKMDEAKGGDVHTKYREATERGHGGHEHDNKPLPAYIVPGTPEERHWRAEHPAGYNPKAAKGNSFSTGSSSAHVAAQIGNVDLLEEAIKQDKNAVNARDKNGWTPMHEAARGGHLDAVKLLVKHGADVNAKTYGNGGTALYWAKLTHGEDHPVIDFLESIGALSAGPEL